MTENNAREKIDDDKDSLYVVLRAAKYGCEQKHKRTPHKEET